MKKSSHLRRTLIGIGTINFFFGAVWMLLMVGLSSVHLLCMAVSAPVMLVAWLYWVVRILAPAQEKLILVQQMAQKHRQTVAVKDTLKKLEELKKKKRRIQ